MKTESQLPYVACCRLVIFLQSDRDVCIGGPANAAIAVREIYARYGQADVVDNPLKFVRRDLVSYGSFHLIDKVGGFLNTRSRSCPHMQPKCARVH